MKITTILVFVIVGLFTGLTLFAQDEASKTINKAYFGFGAGLDYGGLGIKGEFLPSKWLGIFVGGGYNLAEPAFNAGVSFKVLPDKKFMPTVLAMYGYNAAIRIKSGYSGSDFHRKSYYGISVGAGVEMKYGVNNNKASLALLVPFRNAAFRRDYDELDIYIEQDILPIAISLGCNFAINKKKAKK